MDFLLFLEGIAIGIYGNWLISLIEKIDFERIDVLNLMILSLSFSAFVGYFIYLTLGNSKLTTFHVNIFFLGHYGCWLIAYLSFGKGDVFERVFFSFLGVLFFMLVYFAEKRRISRKA